MTNNQRKHVSLILVLNVAFIISTITAINIEGPIGKPHLSDHHKMGSQLSTDPVEQQHQQDQDILAAMEGYQLPTSLEEELEQRLLIASILEGGEQRQDNQMDNERLYYNAEDTEDNDPEAKYLFQNQEKRSSPPNSFFVFRRGCVRRGVSCDQRPNDCCYSSSCRCNLWGSNCRCQRMGLFQKWG